MRDWMMLLATVATVALAAGGCGGDGNGDLDTDYPSAGEDRFERTVAQVEIEVTLPGVSALPVGLGGLETVELEGPMLVLRGDPEDGDGDGRVDIETEIVELTLTGTSSFGPIEVRQSPERRSMGAVEQQEAGQDFPADSFFDIYLEVEILDLGLVGYNDEAIRMESVLSDLPPGFRDQYEGALALPTPLLSAESDEEFARILDAIHTPNPPPEGEEQPDEGETPAATEPPVQSEEISDSQLQAIVDTIIPQILLPEYELDEARTGFESNEDWIAESLNVKDAPEHVETTGRTGGYRVEWFSSSANPYQIRISLSAFDSSDGPGRYLGGQASFLEGGIGSSSLHEGNLLSVEEFTPDPTLGTGAVGLTLTFGEGAPQYHQTYVGAPEGQMRGSVSLFTGRAPTDEDRRQATELLLIVLTSIVQALEGE